MKNLIIFFSRSGENYVNGKIEYLSIGNTKKAAQFIKEAVGGTLFEVEAVNKYPDNYRECVAETRKEFLEKARPKLKQYLEDVNEYDTVFVGYPNWCGTFPMPVFSLLEKIDFSGKKIAPFCSNEGSGMGKSENDIRDICKGATVLSGLSIHGAETYNLKENIQRWAKEMTQK